MLQDHAHTLEKEKVVITGSGLISSALALRLSVAGYEVYTLSRNPSGCRSFFWDIGRGVVDPHALADARYVIHLAGANVATRRWTPTRKEEIVASRVRAMPLLRDTLLRQGIRLKAFISASGVGYYGVHTVEHIFSEDDPPGNDFLSAVCLQWEAAATELTALGCAQRTAQVRISLALSARGGALARLMPLARNYLGVIWGDGRQYMPWIHIDDLCGIFHHIMVHPALQGPFNAAAPQHVACAEFMSALARSVRRSILLPPVPRRLIQWALGKERASMLLEGSRISSRKIQESGYAFQYPELLDALVRLCNPGA